MQSLGDRIKENYESRTCYKLPRRTYTIIRLDGKAFHTYTRNCSKPFDKSLMNAMASTTVELVAKIQGAKLGYTQSDEISILLTDFDKITTEAWFNNNIQKIVSVSASMTTAYFNSHHSIRDAHWNVTKKPALFDSRAFTIPERWEVFNYFYWRWLDCERNSIQAAAQSFYSHKELQGKSCKEIQEMLFTDHSINWATHYLDNEKNGTIVKKTENDLSATSMWNLKEEKQKLLDLIPSYD